MTLNVAQLLKEGIGSSRSYEVDGTVSLMNGTGRAVFRGKVNLMRTDKGIWASGPLSASVEDTCGRCLDKAEVPVYFRVDDEYLPMVDIETGSISAPAEDTEEVFTLDAQHTLNLTEAVRQYIIVAMPMKPLCMESCEGICYSCGTNLNGESCSCPDARDSRWNSLLGFSLLMERDSKR
jgi:uncharacterized protein